VGAGTGEETRGEETAAAAAEAIASDASDGEDPKNALVALRLLDSAPTLRFFSHPYPAISCARRVLFFTAGTPSRAPLDFSRPPPP
jgi:hypothetical protein